MCLRTCADHVSALIVVVTLFTSLCINFINFSCMDGAYEYSGVSSKGLLYSTLSCEFARLLKAKTVNRRNNFLNASRDEDYYTICYTPNHMLIH